MKEKSDSKDIYSIIKIFQINTSLFLSKNPESVMVCRKTLSSTTVFNNYKCS